MPVQPRRPHKPRPLRVLRGGQDRQSRRLLQRHLALLRTYRASEAFVAFVWPAEVRQVHSVIDQVYGRELEERVAYAPRVQRLEGRLTTLEALRRAEERI